MEITVSGLRWMLVLQDVIFLLIGGLVFGLYLSQREKKPILTVLHLNKSCNLEVFGLCFVLMLALQPFINLLGEINSHIHLPQCLSNVEAWMNLMEEQARATTLRLLSDTSIGGIMANIVVVGVVAAFCEEVLFRGALQNIMLRICRPHLAIWLSAFIFAFIHLQFAGFIPRMLMGGLFGYIVWWSGSLWPVILMHFVNNTGAIFAYLYCLSAGLDIKTMDRVGVGNSWWLTVVSVVVSAGIIYYLASSLKISSTSSRRNGGNSMFRS